MEPRLPTHLEVAGMIRAVEAASGFATVIKKGERDAGTLLVVCCKNGTNACTWERMPQMDGTRMWTKTRQQDPTNPAEFWDYCTRRHDQDRDLWVVELDVPDPERFLTGSVHKG
ncbi:conserved hypothetical protein [Altererythrobacter sp. B11]|uniref:DUF1491 family protein n=1 Tax=Altererythrobacter sp. B11 TaxID=2060312 RepID=UPI000DC6D3B4|nr:DUF1491 family protein [Altererythrobacter sp. B11]BBC71466.1 conserved hypothetical protein [Altererythrobacter sp. B11]